MAASLGPRVGGAHVDVNLKFDEKSIATVGKQIKKQLSTLSKDLEKIGNRNRDIYQGIGQSAVTAWRALLGTFVTGAPLLGGAISGLSGAATELAGALYSVGQSSAALLPIFTSLGVAGLTLKVGMRGFGEAVSEVDPKRLQLMLKEMPKSMQRAVLATRKLSNEMRDAVWPVLFKGLSDGIENLRNTGTIQRGLGLMAESLNGLAKSVLTYANSKGGVKTLNTFFENNAKVFKALSKIAVPFLDGFLRLINALSPAAIRLAGYVEDIAKQFQKWTKGEGFGKRVDDAMKGAQKTAGLLWKILGNLGSAIMNIFNAANPATNTFLQMLVDVTQRFQDWTESVGGKNTIAEWAGNAVDVMRQFGHTLEAIFPVIAELADPRVIMSFLATVQGAFELLGKLPLDKMVDAFVTVSEALQPVSSFFLAMIIAGAALNIMIGSVMGQLGGLFSILSKIVQFKIFTTILKNMGDGAGGAAKKTSLLSRAWAFILRIIDKVKAAFGKVVGFFTKTSTATAETASKVSRLASIFKPVMSILARFVKFAGPVGIAVWIGIIIAKSKDLQAKLVGVWDAVKGVFSQLGESFAEIGKALKPLAPVAEAAGNAFSFVFDIIDKIATLAVGVVLDMIIFGFKSLGKVIEGAGHIIAGFINVLVGLFTLDFGKVWDGLKQMASGLTPLLQGLFGLFITFFAPARLAKLGLVAMKGLGAGLKAAMPAIMAAVGRFLGAAVRFFAGLPARLAPLGVRAMSQFGSALRSGLGALKGIATTLVTAIVNIIKGLPGKLLGIGGALLAAGMTLGSKILEGIRRGLTAIGDMAGSVASSLKNGINNAIGLPKDMDINVLGKKIGFTIPGFEKGGIAPGGPIAVGERGIEILSPPRGSRVTSNKDLRKMGSGLPKTVVLRIGSRDFLAYVEEIADDRINASDNLAWQGA
jgi:hypothetical protein